MLVQEEDWSEAIEADGTRRPGAWVVELTDLIDMSDWGKDVRLVCRRKRPCPGARLSLFDTLEGLRHQCFITTSDGEIELRHRGHARVEDRIRAAKAMWLSNLPFRGLVGDEAWLALVLAAMDLVAWTKLPGRRPAPSRAQAAPLRLAPCRRASRPQRKASVRAAREGLAVG